MKFIWQKKYSVGLQSLDEQHKHFFEITNKLHDLLKNYSGAQEKELEIIFDELLNYALYHLAEEEEFFLKCKYEETEVHCKMHETYREKMRDYRQKIRECSKSEKIKLAKEAQKYAVNWLSEHILKVDQRYTSTLKKCLG
ncbi:bacteriohemerythrin [Candidatus Peregrinibacteria bacterium]|nr:bacteriohemerythrin [Candidatus Peregrinibacteria bacterium]